MLTEKEKEYIKRIKEEEVGLPIHFILEDKEKGTMTFYFENEGGVPITSKVTYEQAREKILYKAKLELTKRICTKILFETGNVPDRKLVEALVDTVGLKPEQIADANDYETLKRCEELVMTFGPDYRASKMYMNKNGKIIGVEPSQGYIKPHKRILKTF